jgi:hypothetical protein
MRVGLRTTCTAIITLTICLAAAVTPSRAQSSLCGLPAQYVGRCDCGAAGEAGAGVGSPPLAGEPLAGQPLDLGEAAPAQIGATFALAAPGFMGV